MDLGSKIKQRRILLQLSQEELANRCELTKGYISLLENNKTSPSLETLSQILEVLGISLKDFFDEEKQSNYVFPVDEQFEKDYGTYVQTWLVPTSQVLTMEPILIVIKPSGKTIIDMPHQGEEFGYVIEGEINVIYGEECKKCKKGEAFYIITNKSHYIENVLNSEAKIVWVSCPPNF